MFSIGLVILQCFIHDTKDKTIKDEIKDGLTKMCGTDSAFCDIVLNL